jgi:hypothetical protein
VSSAIVAGSGIVGAPLGRLRLHGDGVDAVLDEVPGLLVESNGLALCTLHHNAPDLGVLGISTDRRVLVSQAFHGGAAAHAAMTRYAGHRLLDPDGPDATLDERHRAWHQREVFRAPARTSPVTAAAEGRGPWQPD